MNFASVYVHAIDYRLKLEHCTRLLLDSFAQRLVSELSAMYGLDQQHVTATVRPVLEKFAAAPEENIPTCKATTYRGKESTEPEAFPKVSKWLRTF